ncbi:MAG: DUF4236 domain-containing protein [Ilumatobacteraceae bacterium]|jgi:hypothetical protein
MGFSYRKRIRTGRRSWLNISKRGVSGSARFGPFTVNSRGRTSLRLGKGLSYRGGCATVLVVGVGLLASAVGMLIR